MARNSREVKVLITGDATKLVGALSDVQNRVGRMSGVLKGALAGVSVAAIGRGIMNVAEDFQNMATAANDFATASGLSVEQASRWQEVAGDLGVDASKLQSSIGRLNKELGKDANKWKQYGIVVARTADGQVDANVTFLRAIDALHDIKDPLERAKLGAELFGRSWADLAPLVEKSADQLDGALAAVGDAQVIDEAEVEKAKKFRDTMDNLTDATMGLKLSLAEGLIPTISVLAEWVSGLDPKMVGLAVSILGIVVVVGKLSSAIMGVNSVLSLFAAHPVFIAVVGIIAAITLIALNWDKVTAAIQRATAATDSFFAKNVGNPINTVLNKIGIGTGGGSKVQLTDKAKALVGQKATGGNAWGPTIVGEHGRELVWPRGAGAYVSNATNTAAMLGGGRGGDTFNVYAAPGMNELELARAVIRARNRADAAQGRPAA